MSENELAEIRDLFPGLFSRPGFVFLEYYATPHVWSVTLTTPITALDYIELEAGRAQLLKDGEIADYLGVMKTHPELFKIQPINV